MRKFDEQFMNRFMLPLVGEIVTDLGKGEKNLFLNKLLKGQKLEDADRREFIRNYFETRQDPGRKQPFADMGEAESRVFWNKFLDGFGSQMIMRFRLSGEPGTREAFCPGKDGAFSQQATNNLYNLAYRITLDFENERMAEIVKGDKTKEKLLKEGKLKLVTIKENGKDVEQVISEDEVAAAAALPDSATSNLDVTPATSVGLGLMKAETAVPAIQSGARLSSEGEKPVTAAPAASVAKPKPKFSDIKNDFAASKKAAEDKKYELIIKKLEDSGLTIEINSFKDEHGEWKVDAKGILIGQVRDRDNNLLSVKIQTRENDNYDKKFEFTFRGGYAPNGKPLDKQHFYRSENDLEDDNKNFKNRNAYEAALPQLPKIFADKTAPPLPVDVPGHGVPGGAGISGQPVDVALSGIELTGQLPEQRGFEMSGKAGMQYVITSGRKAVSRMRRFTRLPKGTKVQAAPPAKRPAPPGSPLANKQERARKAQQRQAGAMAPQAPSGQVPGAQGAQEESSQGKNKAATPWWKTMQAKWLGVSYGATGLGIGGIFAAGSGSAPTPEAVTGAIYMVLHNLGINLFS